MSDKPKTLREIAELARTRQFHAERAGKPITSTDFGEIARHTETWRKQAEALVREMRNRGSRRRGAAKAAYEECALVFAKLLGLEE